MEYCVSAYKGAICVQAIYHLPEKYPKHSDALLWLVAVSEQTHLKNIIIVIFHTRVLHKCIKKHFSLPIRKVFSITRDNIWLNG